jgi:hypothetical protein
MHILPENLRFAAQRILRYASAAVLRLSFRAPCLSDKTARQDGQVAFQTNRTIVRSSDVDWGFLG